MNESVATITVGDISKSVVVRSDDPAMLRKVVEDHGEVRKTDPRTGGQKGVKKQRYDLIPTTQWRLIRGTILPQSPSPLSDRDARRALDLYDGWWISGHEDSSLIEAAAVAMELLGLMLVKDNMTRGVTYRDLAEECLAEVYGFGATKYDDDNWKRGYAWGYSWAAGRRHLIDHIGGVTHDTGEKGSGLPHLAHFVWHCITLHWFTQNMPMNDPRGKP